MCIYNCLRINHSNTNNTNNSNSRRKMEVWSVIIGIVFLVTASASPEIPSKGKHTRLQDALQTALEEPDMPRFAEPIANVTVSLGRDALLACVVENLKGYKVAWVRVDTQTILSIHHNVISQNNRISLTYNDHRSWYLHIKEVEETDRGWYMCQVNTDPMRSRKGFLQVVVPPMIVEGMTSNDMVVREGLNVTLMCKARGYPEPYVMWRREDGEEMIIGGEHVNVVDGEFLHITKVSRLHMAAYLCVASNGVPPSISKRVHLRVQFPPMLSIPNQLEGAYVGQDVILECHTEAYPASINYWTTERGDMIISDTSRAGDKFETSSKVDGYMKFMKLKIRSVGRNDFGTYRCVAKNSLGETDGNIKLDEISAPTTAILSEYGLWNHTLDKAGRHRHRNKFKLNTLSDYGVEEWRDPPDGVGIGNTLGGGGNFYGINGMNGNSIDGDNNLTPVRNPPGAFHNSAGTLAQRNLVGGIIHGIKMQSFGIFKRLSSYFQKVKVIKEQRKDLDTNGCKTKTEDKTEVTAKVGTECNPSHTMIPNEDNKRNKKNKFSERYISDNTNLVTISTVLHLLKADAGRNSYLTGALGKNQKHAILLEQHNKIMEKLLHRQPRGLQVGNRNNKNSSNTIIEKNNRNISRPTATAKSQQEDLVRRPGKIIENIYQPFSNNFNKLRFVPPFTNNTVVVPVQHNNYASNGSNNFHNPRSHQTALPTLSVCCRWLLFPLPFPFPSARLLSLIIIVNAIGISIFFMAITMLHFLSVVYNKYVYIAMKMTHKDTPTIQLSRKAILQKLTPTFQHANSISQRNSWTFLTLACAFKTLLNGILEVTFSLFSKETSLNSQCNAERFPMHRILALRSSSSIIFDTDSLRSCESSCAFCWSAQCPR